VDPLANVGSVDGDVRDLIYFQASSEKRHFSGHIFNKDDFCSSHRFYQQRDTQM